MQRSPLGELRTAAPRRLMSTVGYFEPVLVLAIVMLAMYLATEFAGEVESGLVDLVLARPLPRHRLVTRSLVVMTASGSSWAARGRRPVR